MEILTVYPNSINERHIDRVAQLLRDGGIVLYPTDSVYALGCDALNRRAVERLCRIKGLNPERNLLSITCSDLSQASEYVKIDNRAFAILKEYLPGPYTFLLPAGTRLPKAFRGRHTVGVRIPDNPIARAIAAALGNPLMTASADPDPDDPQLITLPEALALKYDNDVDLMVDGGEGSESLTTVVDISDSSEPQLVRLGKGSWDE